MIQLAALDGKWWYR